MTVKQYMLERQRKRRKARRNPFRRLTGELS